MSQDTVLSPKNSPEIQLPPTQYELSCDDDIPMETYRHRLQMELLVNPLDLWLKERDAFVGGNMFVYFSPDQVRNQDYRGPDVFVVLDVPRGERLSWVVWEEGKAPDVVIELLSESTAIKDKTEKKAIYQNRLRVPEYFWYDPFNPEDFAGFRLQGGEYVPIEADERGRLVSQLLGLALVPWFGSYKQEEYQAVWLRWATLEGILLPTPQEMAVQAQQLAEQERQRAEQAQQLAEQERQRAEQAQQLAEQAQQLAEQERQRAARLAELLRARGINPDEVF